MRRAFAYLLAFLAASSSASAQGLREKISQLFIFGSGIDPLFLAGSADPNNPASIRAHGSHFVPSAVSENGSIIAFISAAIGGNVANAPIGSTSGGETFRFEGGVPVKTSTSGGPIFAERAQTLGKGRTVVGIGRSSSHLSSLRGVDLHDIEGFFTHQNVDFAGCDSTVGGLSCKLMGVPNLENDVMQFKLNLDLRVRVTSLYATMGLTDNFDVGVVVPVISTSLTGESSAQVIPFGGPTAAHFFAGTPSSPTLTGTRSVEGTATGLGDVAVRTKFGLQQSARTHVALLGEARFATGNEDDLLGLGSFVSRGLAVISANFGAFSAHANTGFLYRASKTQNSAVLGTLGFDDLITDHVTIAADLVAEMQVGKTRLQLPAPVQYDYPFKRTINPTTIPNIADNIVNGSFGFKFETGRGFSIVTNALVPLNRGGLRPNLALSSALEYAF
ncbi:MAG TPA: hypothetical protein VIP11_00325 [Gemmatimonadaceae bacterium]